MIDIVIVNWRSTSHVRDCLESIRLSVCDGVAIGTVVVVDNSPEDPFPDEVFGFPFSVKVIRNGQNIGFGAACNQGATQCDSHFILFLNPDTRVTKEALSTPVEFLSKASSSDVGVVGIQLRDEFGSASRTCSRFPTAPLAIAASFGLPRLLPSLFPACLMVEWDHLSTRDVDQVIGAFFFVRREVFSQLHGFDERFFVYFEEVDFCLRARQRGWRVVYLAQAMAYHRGQGTTDQIKATRLAYSLHSRLQYFWKHADRASFAAVAFSSVIVEPITRIVLAAGGKSQSTVGEIVFGYALLFGTLARSTLQSRPRRRLG